jgi:hypothetical protein
MSDKIIVLDTPEQIEAFRLLAIKGRLKMEMRGIRFRISTFGVVRREFGFKGSRQKVYDQYIAMLKEKGILKDG